MTKALAVLVLLGALVYTGIGLASGGNSIATAPTIQPGTRIFGNTASDPVANDLGADTACTRHEEFWRIFLAAGDYVSFAGQQIAPATHFDVEFFAPGLTDTALGGAHEAKSAVMTDGLNFTASASGTWLILVGSNCNNGVDGPFEFTVAVRHKVVVFLPKTGAVGRSGLFSATVLTPNGSRLTDPGFSLHLYAIWRPTTFAKPKATLVGTAAPNGGTVKFSFHLPAAIKAGRFFNFRVEGGGGRYLPVSAQTRLIKVT